MNHKTITLDNILEIKTSLEQIYELQNPDLLLRCLIDIKNFLYYLI